MTDGDRQRLALHLPEVAHELAVERCGSRAGIFTIAAPSPAICAAFVSMPATRPSARRTTRSAIAGDGGIVRDHDGRGPELAVDALERLEDHNAGGDVERAGRLVTQEHVRPLRDRAGDRDALLLAARELRREVIEPVIEARPAPAPRSGVIGCSTISVTSATFSRAVRLGIRL